MIHLCINLCKIFVIKEDNMLEMLEIFRKNLTRKILLPRYLNIVLLRAYRRHERSEFNVYMKVLHC